MTSIEEDIDSLLDALNNSRNISEAEAAIESLHALLKQVTVPSQQEELRQKDLPNQILVLRQL